MVAFLIFNNIFERVLYYKFKKAFIFIVNKATATTTTKKLLEDLNFCNLPALKRITRLQLKKSIIISFIYLIFANIIFFDWIMLYSKSKKLLFFIEINLLYEISLLIHLNFTFQKLHLYAITPHVKYKRVGKQVHKSASPLVMVNPSMPTILQRKLVKGEKNSFRKLLLLQEK